MGRRRRSNCCDFSGQNFNSKCFTFFVTLKILVWCCIWIYLLKYYVFSDYEAIMTQNQSQSSLDNINNMDNMDNSNTPEIEQWDDDQSYGGGIGGNRDSNITGPMDMGVSGPMQFGQKSKPIITPLPDDIRIRNGNSTGHHTDYGGIDEYGDYDDNYEQYYEDIDYAQAPPKKKKYRESDASIKPPSYEEAKDLKDKQIRDKHEKRYSKYDNFYDRTDLEDSKEEDSYDKPTAILTDNVQSGSTKSIGGKRKGKGKSKGKGKDKGKASYEW
mmetsp:Transcript_46789/g.41854  ORF Transcript_46789/g.41854 Transcript_46789/m.41854 type:complete len:271 (-) Transcript_46789:134-946(-)